MRVVGLYSAFAVVATVANIVAQDISIRLYAGPCSIAVSMAAGTGLGLLVKYVLDKRFIFSFQARNALHDGATFVLYSLMGVLTTIVFWGFEYAFHLAFETKGMRYAGGILGLGLGYLMKYRLDRRYVFRVEAKE